MPSFNRDSSDGVFDLAIAEEQIEGGEEVIREIAKILIDELSKLMDEIKVSFRDADATRLKRAAHTLKGSADVFGAHRTVKTARKIEELAQDEKFDAISPVIEELKDRVAELRTALTNYFE